jgi:hypothetical protein
MGSMGRRKRRRVRSDERKMRASEMVGWGDSDRSPYSVVGGLELRQRVIDGFNRRLREGRMTPATWIALALFMFPVLIMAASIVASALSTLR